jgi:hypothetical protein
MVNKLANILLPYKLVEMILSWFFPASKQPVVSREDKVMDVMVQYFLFVNEAPCDEYRIEFSDKDRVLIYLIYDSVEDAYNNVYRRSDLKEDMSNMFPYTFFVISLVSE